MANVYCPNAAEVVNNRANTTCTAKLSTVPAACRANAKTLLKRRIGRTVIGDAASQSAALVALRSAPAVPACLADSNCFLPRSAYGGPREALHRRSGHGRGVILRDFRHHRRHRSRRT